MAAALSMRGGRALRQRGEARDGCGGAAGRGGSDDVLHLAFD
jgi:hypothetical protein